MLWPPPEQADHRLHLAGLSHGLGCGWFKDAGACKTYQPGSAGARGDASSRQKTHKPTRHVYFTTEVVADATPGWAVRLPVRMTSTGCPFGMWRVAWREPIIRTRTYAKEHGCGRNILFEDSHTNAGLPTCIHGGTPRRRWHSISGLKPT